jgi:hypothetical protein
MLPLLEKFIRFTARENGQDEASLSFTEGGALCRVCGKALGVSDQEAFEFWRAFRNGILHRATINAALPYQMHPDKIADRLITLGDGTLHVYIWPLRTKVVGLLESAPKRLWTSDEFPLPDVYHTEPFT